MEKTIKPKEIGKIKLNQLSKQELEEREMKVLKGGRCPCCDKCAADPKAEEDAESVGY